MSLMPMAEAAEQTILQRVVPLQRQGRVFGFAMAIESAAAPVSAFIVGPIAQFIVIPYMKTPEGQARFGWLVGDGQARGIALLFVAAAVLMLLLVLVAFTTKAYRNLSAAYANA